jgi:uncharacterized protein YecA (UPF0149 family)
MDTDEISQKIKNAFKKSATATKNALEKAGEKIQDISDKNAVKMEIHKAQKQIDEKYLEAGKKLYLAMASGATIDFSKVKNLPEGVSENDFSEIFTFVKKTQKTIKEKENALQGEETKSKKVTKK